MQYEEGSEGVMTGVEEPDEVIEVEPIEEPVTVPQPEREPEQEPVPA